MRKINEENERIKRTHAQWLREAEGKDHATVDKAMSSILRFEESTNFRSFKQFHIEQAISFKALLAKAKNQRTKQPLSKSTIDSTLRHVKNFIHWLAGQQGYKSRIGYADAKYFNNNAKDARVAHTRREIRFPTMEQAAHAFRNMPEDTLIARRNKALFAFLMLTGARDGAIASLKLKHVNLEDGSVYHDARDVKTKNSKTFTTWFFPVPAMYEAYFERWIKELRNEQLFGNDDPLFPRPFMGLSESGGFQVVGLMRENYTSAGAIRKVIKEAFNSAGLPSFAPHSFRKTLVHLGDKVCPTREDFKAWSMNLGHESVVISIGSYLPISETRQAELIKRMK